VKAFRLAVLVVCERRGKVGERKAAADEKTAIRRKRERGVGGRIPSPSVFQ